jgi:hypothetical protein
MEQKIVAVFLDYSKARFISVNNGIPVFSDIIESDFEPHPRHRGEGSNQARFDRDPYHGSNNEFRNHRLEEELRKRYFLRLSQALQKTDEILLFGPGEVKKEFFHHLKEQSPFRDKHIHVQNCDYLSDNQLLELVRYFYASAGRRMKNPIS